MSVTLFLKCAGWCLLGGCLAQPSQAQAVPPVTIPQSEHRVVQSKVAGHPYDVYVHLPAGYSPAATASYPVLYVVDGDNDFAPTLEYLGLLMAEYHIPEPLVVAIGDGGPIGSPGNQRTRDFTPTATADRPGSGGAPAFLGFIEQELFPLIEKNYRADPARRTYYGYSLGGLFGAYVLFSKPTLFQNILLGSPALGYDSGQLFELEKAYHATHAALPVHVFMEVGALEPPSQQQPYQRLATLLQSGRYQGLDLHSLVLAHATHLTGKPDTMLKALGWAYTSPHATF
ncbi:alpha/beta hydrolase [Hymenobacter sp. RP-2-7]|uniref:Alpha/beta hydrolase n=1 Tax=Hymenobacter polaris TaxID=2682546 RepID=A0A7Y0AC62_9BACT|nr:alpha/beta hydrolase-fold protein [Hymenobacter polaris]NML64643.1 alpha/beta hydrolase [Hymenobacter polaris]